jgi:phosphatidylglycerol:prolipoprotein diacylglycerol transferase
MLPVLWNIVIPAGWAKPGAVLLAVVIALARGWAHRRRARGDGDAVSWREALWDDRWVVLALVGAAGFAWRGGYLDREIRLPLHTYGVALAMGFIVAIALAQREARRVGQDPERLGDLAFWVLLSALAGSRVYFILVNWRDYFGDATWLVATRVGRIPRVLAIWEGGLVFYGGFIAAAVSAFVYLRRHGMRFLPYADTAIPSVAIGHFFGRLGCFAAGCCWGEVSQAHLPWLMRFPRGSLAYQTFAGRPNVARFLEPSRLTTLPLHPTQIYEALGELVIFTVLVAVVRPRKRFEGQILATWLALYAVLRMLVEIFRGDVERGVYAGFGVGQWTSIVILALGAAVWIAGRRTCAGRSGAAPA